MIIDIKVKVEEAKVFEALLTECLNDQKLALKVGIQYWQATNLINQIRKSVIVAHNTQNEGPY